MRTKRKGRISRIGSYAIASSIRDNNHHHQPCITCTTFNILAPIYKRLSNQVLVLLFLLLYLDCFLGGVVFFYFILIIEFKIHQDQSCRESDCRANWLARNNRILDWLLYERSSIICLQVFLFNFSCCCFVLFCFVF